jgi:L-seryl-tRNA(Ser) seleniumtransferase
MLATPLEALRARAERLRVAIAAQAPSLVAELIEVRSAVGGGALPRSEPPSCAVALGHPRLSPEALDARLRAADPPLVGRIADGRLLLDTRTLSEQEIDLAALAFRGLA